MSQKHLIIYPLSSLLALSSFSNASSESKFEGSIFSDPYTRSMQINKDFEGDKVLNEVTEHLSNISNVCDPESLWSDGLKMVESLRQNYLMDLPKNIGLTELYNYANGSSETFEISGPNGTTISVVANKELLKENLPSGLRVGTYAFASAHLNDDIKNTPFDRNGFVINYEYNVLGGYSFIQGSKTFPVTLRILFSKDDQDTLVKTFKSELSHRINTICDQSTNLLITFLQNDETDPTRFVKVQQLIQKRKGDFLNQIENGSTKEDLDTLFEDILRVGVFLRDSFAEYRESLYEGKVDDAEQHTDNVVPDSDDISDHHLAPLPVSLPISSDSQSIIEKDGQKDTESKDKEDGRKVGALKMAFGGDNLADALKAKASSLSKLDQSEVNNKPAHSGNNLLDALALRLQNIAFANSDELDNDSSEEWSDN